MAWHELAAWANAVLAGMATPLVIAVVLAATTLLIEDIAIAAGVALATQGAISWELSFAAVAMGIALGDLMLYGAGRGSLALYWVKRRASSDGFMRARARLLKSLPEAVLLARVIPGLRLTTYVACGAMRIPAWRFLVLVVVAVLLWTLGLYVLSLSVGMALAHYLGVPAPVAVALPMIAFALAVFLVHFARSHRKGVPA